MSKRISKETRRRRKRNRARKYRRKMALRNQPRTTQEKADAAAFELTTEDGAVFSGSFSLDIDDHQLQAFRYACSTAAKKVEEAMRQAALVFKVKP